MLGWEAEAPPDPAAAAPNIEETGGGVLQTAVSAKDQIFGLDGGIGIPDLPESWPGAPAEWWLARPEWPDSSEC